MPEGRPPGGDALGVSNGAMLTSWKEIAAFFDRDIRTVQRWERQEGLPVHRHAHSRQSTVYAYPSELNAWWEGHQHSEEPSPEPAGSRRFAFVAATAIVVALLGSGGISVRKTSPHSFAVTRFAEGSGLPWVRSFADVNGDGLDDLVTHSVGGVDTGIYFGRRSIAPWRNPDVRIRMQINAQVSAGVVGDVDGDGIADLVVTAMLKDPDGFKATGPSFLVRGRREWPAALQLPGDADVVLSLDATNDARVGPHVRAPVDVNSDGLSDIVLGAADYCPLGRASAGGVFVLFGRRTWPARMELRADADIVIYGSRTGEGLGGFASGDINGDGATDLLVLAGEHTLWNLLGGRGRVYVLPGRRDWPRLIDFAEQPVPFLQGTVPGSTLTAPAVADFNGDRFDDIALGIVDHQGLRGRVAMFMGRRDLWSRRSFDDADAVLAPRPPSAFGLAASAADLNGDGLADLLVGDPRRGTIQAFLGRRQWPREERLTAYRPLDLVAGSLGAGAHDLIIGDTDGDGATELAFSVLPSSAGLDGPAWSGLLSPHIPLAIDVRPGFSPNALVRSGLLVVGIAAEQGTVVSDLDPESLRFVGTAPTEFIWRDFTGDGVADLQLYFDPSKLVVRQTATRLAIVGRTRDGLPVAGADDVVVVPLARAPSR